MQTTLYPYQQAIRDDIITKGDFSVALFMAMGTGKTVTSLSIFEHCWKTNRCDKLVVVCIANKVDEWNEDIEKELGHDFQYSVVSFESIWRPKRKDWYVNFIDNRTMVILDESHKIKSATSKVSKFMLEIYNQTKYKLILTGTPQSQWYVDYYPQMRFINAKDYDLPYKKWESIFVRKRLNTEHGLYHYEIEGYNYEDILKKGIAEKAYYKLYEGDYDKPIEIYQDIPHSKEAIKFKKDRVWRDPDEERGEDIIADTPPVYRIRMRQACSGFIGPYDIGTPKEEWLKEFLEIQQTRVVIFVCFVKEVERIEELCKKMKRPVGVYYGARKDLKPFQDNENGVVIVNYASGAVGINKLSIANVCVMYSPPDGDFILFSQARARIHRIGQTKQPVFYYLQTKGSIEKGMYECFKRGQSFDDEQYKAWLELNEKT